VIQRVLLELKKTPAIVLIDKVKYDETTQKVTTVHHCRKRSAQQCSALTSLDARRRKQDCQKMRRLVQTQRVQGSGEAILIQRRMLRWVSHNGFVPYGADRKQPQLSTPDDPRSCATNYKCCSMPVVVTPRLLQSNNTACVRAALSLDDAATAAGFAQCCHVHVKVIECDSASSNKLLMKQVAAELERTSPRSRVVLQHYSDGSSS